MRNEKINKQKDENSDVVPETEQEVENVSAAPETKVKNSDPVPEPEDVIEVVSTQHIVDKASVEKAIRNSVMVSAGLGLVPLPFFDFAALTATGLDLTRKISDMYGVQFKEGVARKLIVTVISASVPSFATRHVSSFLIGVPLIGLPLAVGTRPALNAMVTYAIGCMFATHFEQGGSFVKANIEALKKEFNIAFKGSREKIGDIISGKNENKAEVVN